MPRRHLVLIRSSSFKLASVLAGLFVAASLLLFAFIYWQTIAVETQRFERELTSELRQIPQDDETALRSGITAWIHSPAHRLNYAGLFQADGQPIAGNIPTLPPLPLRAKDVMTLRSEMVVEDERVMMVGRLLSDHRMLVMGRSEDSVEAVRVVLIQALARGLVPATILALVMGFFSSLQSHGRLKELMGSIERIMQGNLQERLPTRKAGVEIDRLAHSVNSMLDEIEQMVVAAKSTGGNIAHDLRTPLTRVRTRLERACQSSQTHDELKAMVEQAIDGLDQALRIITALLRIGKIESGQVQSQFTQLDLSVIICEIGEVFEPVAEEKRIDLRVETSATSAIIGDWELLNEAIVNLVDNALKFTPEGGCVRLVVGDNADGHPVVKIIDNGPGIHPDETEFVWNRYYRADPYGINHGTGLGLSIVRAIAELHGFSITVETLNPGCCFQMVCHNS